MLYQSPGRIHGYILEGYFMTDPVVYKLVWSSMALFYLVQCMVEFGIK